MSSKSKPQEISSDQEPSKSWSPPPPPPRPTRIKTVPNRFHYGVDRSIRGVSDNIPEASESSKDTSKSQNPAKPKSKGVSFKEPVTKPVEDPEPMAKRKQKMSEAPKPPKAKRSKLPSTREQGQSSTKSQPAASQKAQTSREPEQPQMPSVIANAIEDIYLHTEAPEGFTVSPTFLSSEQNERFKENFVPKEFCPVVTLHLDKLKEECNLDLSPWFKPYESLVSIAAPYSPNLVKIFYFNMESDNILDSDDELVEERISTTVKGVRLTISAAILNTILKISNPPPETSPTYSNQQIFSTLRPNEPFPANQHRHLSFKPGSMSPINRTIWYIFSRNFLQKGGSFTHFAQKDYSTFTAFVKKVPINLGEWIFREMSKFRFTSRKSSHILFPSLISVILFYHKIWYVGSLESMKLPPTFGKAQLNLMRISFEEEGSGQSRAPSRSQPHTSQAPTSAIPEQSQAYEETQSAPSDLETRIQGMVDATIAKLSIRLEFEMGKLVAELKRGNDLMVNAQDALKEDVDSLLIQNKKLQEQLEQTHLELTDQIMDHEAKLSTMLVSQVCLDDKVEKILKHLHLSGPGPSDFAAMPKPDPSSTPPTDPLPEPSISAPSFDDDKGGEKGKE